MFHNKHDNEIECNCMINAGGVLPHMLAHGMNPFAFHMPSPKPVSRDDMPLPYGEHHLMQAGAQRMQAQQQAAAAKQAEMHQQLGAAMLASYPGYLPSPFGRVRHMSIPA